MPSDPEVEIDGNAARARSRVERNEPSLRPVQLAEVEPWTAPRARAPSGSGGARPRDGARLASTVMEKVRTESFVDEVAAAFDAAFTTTPGGGARGRPSSPWSNAERADDSPISFGPYTLLEHLGGSAELELWKAVESGGKRRTCVVKKHAAPTDRSSAVRRARLISEGRVGGQLRHKNLTEVYGSGQAGAGAWLAREYVAGASLRAVIELANDSGLSLGAICGLATRVASVLAYAHNGRTRSGKPVHLVHGEISPATILVKQDGTVKVSDFGVTMLSERALNPRTEGRSGKAGYAAPEQLKGLPVDGKADVFSLGIVLVELVGRSTLGGGSFSLDELEEAVRLWCTLREDVPSELVGLLLEMTAIDPARRPDALAVKHRLYAICAALGVSTNPASELRALITENRTVEIDSFELDVDFEEPMDPEPEAVTQPDPALGIVRPADLMAPPTVPPRVKTVPLEIHTSVFEVPDLPPELLKPAEPELPPATTQAAAPSSELALPVIVTPRRTMTPIALGPGTAPVGRIKLDPPPAPKASIAPAAVVRGTPEPRSGAARVETPPVDLVPIAIQARSEIMLPSMVMASPSPSPHGSRLRNHARGLGTPSQPPRSRTVPLPEAREPAAEPGRTRWVLIAVVTMVLSAAAGIAVGLYV